MKKHTRTMAILAAAVATGTLAAGCSGTGNDGPKLLGIVSIASGIDMNDNATKGAKAAAEAAGWTVEVVETDGDASKANDAITNFVTKGADAIITHVYPATVLESGLKAAADKKIPVGSWGGGKGSGVVVDTVTPLGGPSAEAMVEDLGGKGAILALTYHGGQLCIDRETAMDEVLAKYPDITVTKNEVGIPGFLEQAAGFANAWLTSHPADSGPLAIWGCWDDPTLGAISALKQQNRTDVFTYGIQGSRTAFAAIADGTMTATAFQDGYNEGKTMFDTLVQAIDAGDAWQAKTLTMQGQVIRKDGVAAFLEAHPEFKG
jgi:ribose transport system substrate-binding protein